MRSVAVIIEWPDGTIDKGPNPEFVLRRIGKTQWTPLSSSEMRHRLSDRAWALAQVAVDPTLPIEEFFGKLADEGLCRIIEWKEEE